MWASPRPKCYSIPFWLMARVPGLGRRDSSPPRRSMSLFSAGLRVHPSLFSYLRLGEHIVCKSPTLGTLLALVLFLLLFFSYPAAVSSKLFLSQPVILTFCASNFQLHPMVWEGQGELRRVSKWHLAWESLSGGIELGRTIPKPGQMYRQFFKFKVGKCIRNKTIPLGCHFPLLPYH